MNNDSKALKSGIWYTIANFLTKSIGIIITPIFARLMTKAEIGEYSNYTSWLAVFTILVTFHLESTYISAKFDFKEKFDEYISSILLISTVSALIWGLVINCFSAYVTAFLGIDLIYLNCMIVYLMFLPAVNMYQAKERYRYEYKKTVFISVLITVGTALISVVMVVMCSDKLYGRIFGSAIPVILIGAVLYFLIIRSGKRVSFSYWKYALPICLPFIPHLLSLTILNSTDRIMINKFCGAEQNGLYSLAYSCSMVITLLLNSINSAFAPWLGEKLNENKTEDIMSVVKKFIILFMVFSVGMVIAAPNIIMVMGGKKYLEAISVMPPVMLGCVYQYVYTLFVNVEQFKKKIIGMAIASASAALLNYILNYMFIPKYGYIAAAYTTLISYLWLLLIHMLLVKMIGMAHVFNYNFISCSICVMTVLVFLINFIYNYVLIRYIILGLYLTAVAFVALRYKNEIMGLFKLKKTK